MKITFPRLGTVHVGLKSVLEDLGHEVVVPPRITEETVNLGAKHAPETACFPLKINLGSFLEVFREHPDVDMIVMAGGVGPCRFGYYFRTEQDILTDLGYGHVNWVVMEPPRGNLRQSLDSLGALNDGCSTWQVAAALRLGWRKLVAMDDILKTVHRVRAHETQRGAASRIFRAAVTQMENADSLQEVDQIARQTLRRLQNICREDDGDTVRVAIVGEIYVSMEPGANLHIEEALGYLGAEIHRTIMVTDWAKENILLDFLRWDSRGKDHKEAAKPYLNHFVGGEGQASVGSTVLLADAVDGVVHLMPFTCMPEIVAQSVMPQVSKDYDVPVLTLVFDEHTGRAGVLTRLEAFVDLLRRRRRKKGQRSIG